MSLAIALPTNNDWGIPVLELSMQADAVDLPFARWGRERRKSRMKGTWHFYTEDYRFNRLWERPQDLTNSGCVSAVEPNFFINEQTPAAVALYQTYRKRFLARVWQGHGVRIVVDLGVASGHAQTNMIGVPMGWRAYATKGSTERLESIKNELDLARSRAGTSRLLFVVYGGGGAVRDLALRENLLWFPESADVERGRVDV